MRPRIIGVGLEIVCPKNLSTNDTWQLTEGDVDARGTDPKNLAMLVHVADRAGYSLATRLSVYPAAAYLAANGSIKTHTDKSSGLNVACLIAAEKHWDKPELLTRHGALEIDLGDVFVFNADLPHAWLSNDFCVLSSIQVKRRRA